MNYFNEMMVDAFGIMTKRKVSWPGDMTFEQKVSLHEKEIEYWREAGDYEKCIKLQNKLSKLYLNRKNGK
jgi:hypothetical protein